MKSYLLFGIRFASDCEVALPRASGTEPLRFILEADDALLQCRNAPVEVVNHGEWVSYSRYENGEVAVRWRNLLDLWLSPDGHRVKYRRHECCTDECFAAYIANFAISNVLTIQGEEVLHATVVRFRGRTLGFLGDSGAGKSTLTAYLLGLGARIVTDDMLRLTDLDGGCYAEPGQPRIKLFREDAEHLLPSAVELGQWNAYSDKYIFMTECPTQLRDRSTLSALIYLVAPSHRTCGRIHMQRKRGAAAFELLTASTMNRSFKTPKRFRTQMQFAAKVASRIPLYTLSYDRDYRLLPDLVNQIEAKLSDDAA